MSETRYLISIGINDYEVKPLDFCVKDSEDVSKTMTEYCNVEAKNIFNITSDSNKPNPYVFASLQKTVERITSSFVQTEDTLFFYFSGHGEKSDKSTAIVFPDVVLELQDLFSMLSALKPKFIFFLIDSCYSGVGIEDGVGKSSNALLFSQHLKLVSGYNIICASAANAPAKEDSDLKNGRLTGLFIDILRNKLNYNDGILNLSKIFQLIDQAFKNNPHFKQFPFSQTKGLSTYPLSFIDETNDSSFFSTHYVEDIENYDWSTFKNELSHYCLLSRELVNEFTRLVRELLRNSQKWGQATFLKIELGKGYVGIVDNSGTYFDIFNPGEIKIRGGGTTARIFAEHFGREYTYTYEVNEGETIQVFSFKNTEKVTDVCVWQLEDIFELHRFQRGTNFIIPENCEEYKVCIPQGGIDLSTTYAFMESMVKASQQTGKAIIISIDSMDRLKAEFINQLKYFEYMGPHKVIID